MVLNNKIIKSDLENIYSRDIDWSLFDKKTIMITGAYGMLTSYLVFLLCFLKEEKSVDLKIVAQGRSKEKAIKRFGELVNKDYFEFVTFDISKEIQYSNKVDYIIHTAGIANPQLYSTNPVEVIEPNAIGTYNLLKLGVLNNIESFLMFSSGDVYGQVDNCDFITEETIGKIDQLDNHSCYGESKRVAETMCKAFCNEYGVPTKIARISHTFGPTMDIENDPRVFASFMKNAINGEDIVMLSDGTAQRPFCYIADAVAAYIYILLNGKAGEAYNVCNSNEFLSIKEFAEIASKLNKEKTIKVIYKERSKDDNYLQAVVKKDINSSNEKLKELGMEFHFTTSQGMERVYQYFKNL